MCGVRCWYMVCILYMLLIYHSCLADCFSCVRLERWRLSVVCSPGCGPNCSKLHCTVCIQILVRLNKVVSFKLLVEKMKKTWRGVIYKYNRQTDPGPLSFRTMKYFRRNFILLFRLHYILYMGSIWVLYPYIDIHKTMWSNGIILTGSFLKFLSAFI